MQVNTSRPLLPEVLSERGYTTGFATSSPGTTPAFGYGSGIDEFYDITNKYDGMNVRKFFEETKDLPKWRRYLRFLRESADKDFTSHVRNAFRFRFGHSRDDGAAEVTEAAKDFISTAEEPWFLYIHYTETHLTKRGNTPYAIPDEYLGKFFDSDPEYDDLRSTSGSVDYDSEQVDRHERLYDGAIRYLDHQVGKLTDELQKAGEFDNTLLTVTSDHGEVLGENGYLGHGELDEPVLRVPLIMRGPGVNPGRVTDRVGLVGLYRTAVEITGTTPDHARGSNLLRDPSGDVLCQDFTETWDWSKYGERGEGGEHAFYSDGLKLISTPTETLLYDVENDPMEMTNLTDDRPDEARALVERFQEFVADLPTATVREGADIEEDTEERLQELGYIE